MEEAAAQRWSCRLWTLCFPSFFLLVDRLAAGMEPRTPTSSPVPALPCIAFTQKTCEECVKNSQCLWCTANSTCMDYPVSKLIPPSSICELSEANWATCLVNFQVIIISMGVVTGFLLLLIVGCCCLCCYRKDRLRGRVDEEEERFIRDREEKRLQSLQRKHERKLKHNEIRKKYGLLQDSDHPYSRYENE